MVHVFKGGGQVCGVGLLSPPFYGVVEYLFNYAKLFCLACLRHMIGLIKN